MRRGRRLLHALLTLEAPPAAAARGDGDAAPSSSRAYKGPEGGRLGFYAPEYAEAAKAPRGTDLHMVAARLDAGVYQSTGEGQDTW